jgi:secreted trypsin-like serine protease
MLLNNPGGLDGPFIFTSASSTVYAQIHAAGDSESSKFPFSLARA